MAVQQASFSTSTTSMPLVSPEVIQEMRYHPDVLCASPLPASLGYESFYASGCETGFDCYCMDTKEWNPETQEWRVFPRLYSKREVLRFLADEITAENLDWHDEETALSWRTGYLHGWLSALALTDISLAAIGMHVLEELVRFQSVVACGQNGRMSRNS